MTKMAQIGPKWTKCENGPDLKVDQKLWTRMLGIVKSVGPVLCLVSRAGFTRRAVPRGHLDPIFALQMSPGRHIVSNFKIEFSLKSRVLQAGK